MGYMNRKRLVLAALALCYTLASAFGQNAVQQDTLRRGIELFAEGRYAEAVPLFDGLYLDAGAGALRAEGAYWSGMAHIASGDLEAAERGIDIFLATFPDHAKGAELLYQRGRVAYLRKDYERAVQVLSSYALKYPQADYLPSALFWSAESLYALGRLPEADKLYRTLVERYPDHIKTEAARYRMALVQFKYREDELLTLLKWSHEESLRIIEEFQRREKAYEQALAVYQKRYGEVKMGTVAAQTTLEEEIASLKRSMDGLAKELQSRDIRIAELQAQAAAAAAAPPPSGAQAQEPVPGRVQLLDMKDRSLSLIEFYLEKLSAASEGTK
jgi:outer membrane protein assembly factor BamD (BamD/ComL family)